MTGTDTAVPWTWAQMMEKTQLVYKITRIRTPFGVVTVWYPPDMLFYRFDGFSRN